MGKGFVALVGAGPGDIGLLTLKGVEYIKKAEVILYDRLVSEDILELAPVDAKKIDVGKENKKHNFSQKKINAMLLNEALNGKMVVRLKGGDPFLFGRGAEELELLEQKKIPFEVVPGITSAVSAPAYAGIPVTHRDFCSSMHIITGHKKNNEEININFKALVSMKGTIVFMMSVSTLKFILDGLLNAGMDKNMPAAIIENGTRTYQRKVLGTIENLYDRSASEKIKPPSVVVIGEVCSMSQKLDWFSKRPLSGVKIIVTRPKVSGGTLSEKLKEMGACVIDYPCIEIYEICDNKPLEKALSSINDFNWLVFTSKNGVKIFFEYLKQKKKDFRILAGLKIAAIGNQTEKELNDYGLVVDFTPGIYDGKHLAEGLCKITGSNEKILLARAREGNNEIIDILRSNGREYEDVPIYETIYANPENDIVEALMHDNIEIYVTFTSASTVEGFVRTNGRFDLTKIIGICIGSQTAKAAQKYGIKHYISKEATIESMVKKFREVHNESNKAKKA